MRKRNPPEERKDFFFSPLQKQGKKKKAAARFSGPRFGWRGGACEPAARPVGPACWRARWVCAEVVTARWGRQSGNARGSGRGAQHVGELR